MACDGRISSDLRISEHSALFHGTTVLACNDWEIRSSPDCRLGRRKPKPLDSSISFSVLGPCHVHVTSVPPPRVDPSRSNLPWDRRPLWPVCLVLLLRCTVSQQQL